MDGGDADFDFLGLEPGGEHDLVAGEDGGRKSRHVDLHRGRVDLVVVHGLADVPNRARKDPLLTKLVYTLINEEIK